MVKMVNFMLCIFYQTKKQTATLDDRYMGNPIDNRGGTFKERKSNILKNIR